MQSQKEKKQEFLRQQILEPGYDPEQFISYLTESDLPSDIDQLSFKQLQNIVERFKKYKETGSPQKRSSQRQVDFNEECEITGDQSSTNQNKPKQIYYEKHGVSQPQFSKTFKCLKLKEEIVDVAPPKIEVSDPIRKTTGGFFGIGATSFLLFKIDTLEKGWSVRRRYSDFQWLRAIILKFFPTHIVPPLPKKNAAKRTTRDLVKRMNILVFFLNDIASYSEIFSSKYVEGFMSIADDNKFEKLKKEGNDAQAFQTINSLETVTGEVTVSMENQQNKFGQELQTFFEGAQVLYKSVSQKTKLLQNSFVDETNILYEMGNHFADLHSQLKIFNANVPSYAQNNFGTVFVTLNNMVIEWGNIIKNQYQFLEKSFRPFFRYVRNQIYSYREQYAKVKEIEEDYFKARIALEKKKEKIFLLNDMKKWEIPENKLSMVPQAAIKKKEEAMKYMLPKQSQELDKTLLNYAFYMSQYKDNALRLLDRGTERFNDNFKEFAINIKVNAQQLAGLWTEVATNFANPPKEQNIMNKQVEVEKTEIVVDD